jgi:hypothetical protein
VPLAAGARGHSADCLNGRSDAAALQRLTHDDRQHWADSFGTSKVIRSVHASYTAITRAMQKGASSWDAAGHFPDHRQSAVATLNRRA